MVAVERFQLKEPELKGTPIEICNDVTGEAFTTWLPQSRGEVIEQLLHSTQKEARGSLGERGGGNRESPLLCCCVYVFKDGPIKMRHFTEGDVQEARREMQRLIETLDGEMPSGEVSP